MKPLFEEWADIEEHIGMYQVSNFGMVRSCSRYLFRLGRNGELHAYYRPAKLLTPKKRGEYLAVKLWNPSGGSYKSVHRLVASCFCEGEGTEVNHIDEDKYNNISTNLEWCSRSYNQVHSKGPTLRAIKGCEEVVVKGVRAMAKELGISLCSVQRMLRGDCKSVKGWEVTYQSFD